MSSATILGSDGASPDISTRTGRKKQERKCDLCSQSFSKAEHLARHVRIHTREKPFQCGVCNKYFTRHDTLLRHARSHSETRRSSSTANTPLADFVEGEGLEGGLNMSPYSLTGREDQSSQRNQRQMMSGGTADLMTQALHTHTPSNIIPLTDLSSNMASYHVPSSSTTEGEVMSNLGYNSLNDNELWNMNYDMPWPSWSVGSDFDLQAMNASIAATIMQPFQVLGPIGEQYDHSVHYSASLGIQTGQEQVMDAVSRAWTSQMDSGLKLHTVHGTITPMNETDHTERADVDEVYRSRLARRLQQRPYDNSLPSTEFLNLCVQLYFARFHSIFPIVHAPTFRPSVANSLLLISVCSIGSLFIGSASATAQGVRIFETLNKCILNSWERYLSRSSTEGLSMIQAAIIGQTFGLLSSNPAHPNLVDAFNGTVIAWARQLKMFKEKQAAPLDGNFQGDRARLENAWKSWIVSEQMIRVVLAVHVQDAELASMFHHEPLLRHEHERTPIASSERLFSAPNANQWGVVSLQDSQKRYQSTDASRSGLASMDSLPYSLASNSMTEYALLAGIGASICEKIQQGQLNSLCQEAFVTDLIAWSTRWSNRSKEVDPFCLKILWHSLFVSLFGDFDTLERAIGRDGTNPAAEVQGYVQEWASSISAKRCVTHASLLAEQLETMHIGSEPAVHVPQSLFKAAITWYLYAHFASCEDLDASQQSIEFPEIRHLGIAPSHHLFKTSKDQPGKPTVAESRRLCTLRDMLQRFGRWGIARRFAGLVGILLEGDAMNNSGFGSYPEAI